MYKELIGKKVTIIVSTRGEAVFEYQGVLAAEDENNIALTEVKISYLMTEFTKNIFGSNMANYKEENLGRIILNKKYIISCYSI